MVNIDKNFNELLIDLTDVLQAESQHVIDTINRLESIRASVIKRDEESLSNLLAKIQNEGDSYRPIEIQRQEICRKLADIFGVDQKHIRLSFILEQADDIIKDRLFEQQQALKSLVSKLKIEHQVTVQLLRDCARFNQLMLRNLMGCKDESITYDAVGQKNWNFHNGVLSYRT